MLDCSLIAGEKLLGDPTNEEQRKIVDFFSDAAAVDMESVAVARATYEARRTVGYNPRFLVIRGVSDLIRADPKISNDAERANWTAAACRSAACFAKDLVESFLATPDPRS